MPLSLLDIAALVWFVVMLMAYEIVTGYSRYAGHSLSAGVTRHRRAWLAHMAEREQRHFDAILLASLSQSHAFFASTSVLGIGGLAAVMGSGDTARHMLEKLPLVSETPQALWEIKILFLISILIYAFFKFAWAFRLSHYSVIMFGAMAPSSNEAAREQCHRHAQHTARLLDLVGQHANSGLRSFYYAFAAIAWLFHPLLFILAMALVFAILMRREFVSRAAEIISAAAPPPTEPKSSP
ncbi:MAG: DUF599 domain-containing protein [Hyphomicrobiaceae bacterium]